MSRKIASSFETMSLKNTGPHNAITMVIGTVSIGMLRRVIHVEYGAVSSHWMFCLFVGTNLCKVG